MQFYSLTLMQPQIKKDDSLTHSMYTVRNTSLCTPTFTRQMIESAVERGATIINLNAVQFAPPPVIEQLASLRREYDISYVNIPEKTEYMLQSKSGQNK